MINLIELTSTGKVNSPFGYRGNIGVSGASTNHKGIDITLKNDNIPAVLDSRVLDKGTDASRGNWIKVRQSDGTTAGYFHLAKLPAWAVGSYVPQGSTIGIQGNTGISSGKHLHYEVQNNGAYIDPEKYLSAGGSYSMDNSVETVENSDSEGVLATIIRLLVYLILAVLAVVLFFLAFDIKIM